MKLIKYICLLVFVLTLTLIVKPIPSYACSCVPSPPVEEELERANSVFSGKVLSIEEDTSNEFEPIKVTFQVNEIWKGENTSQISVYTARDSASCGFNFSKDESYLVYAIQNEGILKTGICSLTKELSRANDDLTILGEGEVLTNKASDNTTSSLTTWIILSTMFILGLVLLYLKTRKKA
ncbi:hypothetical protein [Bacillus sp. AK128]